jgi:hypothetical protein
MKRKEKPLIDRLEEAAGKLICCCECDGRGCTICIASDLLYEAAATLKGIKE